jgi:hypothetical protein
VAQFDYLGTWKDSWALLTAILEPGDVTVIPDLRYPEPHLQQLRSLEGSYKELLNLGRSYFLYSSLFSRFPPALHKIESGRGMGSYRIEGSQEGPLLHLVLPACFREEVGGRAVPSIEEGPGLHLAPGMLSYQRSYECPNSDKCKPVSAEVKAGYKEIARRMKSCLVRHEFHEPIWIGRDALVQVQEHCATIHGFGLD